MIQCSEEHGSSIAATTVSSWGVSSEPAFAHLPGIISVPFMLAYDKTNKRQGAQKGSRII